MLDTKIKNNYSLKNNQIKIKNINGSRPIKGFGHLLSVKYESIKSVAIPPGFLFWNFTFFTVWIECLIFDVVFNQNCFIDFKNPQKEPITNIY